MAAWYFENHKVLKIWHGNGCSTQGLGTTALSYESNRFSVGLLKFITLLYRCGGGCSWKCTITKRHISQLVPNLFSAYCTNYELFSPPTRLYHAMMTGAMMPHVVHWAHQTLFFGRCWFSAGCMSLNCRLCGLREVDSSLWAWYNFEIFWTKKTNLNS